ncbi:MAG TPA: hypothetical protein VE079_06955 [Ensifer sp.]|nr:hypothetical protein [Ensifer sp.]
MPDIMRREWIGPLEVDDETIKAMTVSRWFFQQTSDALGLPGHCPKLRCRRRQACVSFTPAPDYCAEPMKLYPPCIRNADAVRLLHRSLETIAAKAEKLGADADDEVFLQAFVAASDSFRRARLATEAAEKAAAEKAKREAQVMWWLWKKRK